MNDKGCELTFTHKIVAVRQNPLDIQLGMVGDFIARPGWSKGTSESWEIV